MLGPIHNKLDNNKNSGSEVTEAAQHVRKEQSDVPIKADGDQQTNTDEMKEVSEESSPAHPTKKRCLPSLTDVTDSLTKQVALLSTVAGPHIAEAAAEAAVTALCQENPCAQSAFAIDENEFANKFGLTTKDEMESNTKFEGLEIKRQRKTESSLVKSFGATTFRMSGHRNILWGISCSCQALGRPRSEGNGASDGV